ncbi:ABC transporter permease [Lentisalinibacter orientalis]|uniref:ABC transporter permease n=1 Tax=Lentisalinibacter orientalis TaxID=2992241 RepID=UPI0038683A57
MTTLALVGLVTLGPIAVVIGGGADLAALAGVFTGAESREALGYSLLLALRAPFAAIIGFAIAWALIRFPIPGARFLEGSFWLAFMLPVLPLTLGWTMLLDGYDGLVNTWLMRLPLISEPVFDIQSLEGILWVHMTASTVPVMIILLGPAIRQLDGSLEEAARVSGASPRRVLGSITIPLLSSAILTGTILGFIRGLEAFEVEQFLGAPAGISVYTTRVFDLANWQPPRFEEAMALSTVVLVFLAGLALLHRRIVERNTYATVLGRGGGSGQLSLGRLGRYAITGALFLTVGLSSLVPTGVLLLGSFMTLFGFFGIEDPLTLDNWRAIFSDPTFFSALGNSLVIAFGAGFLGILIYSVLAYLIARSQLSFRGTLDFLTWLPWCIPGILLGLGFLALVLEAPFLGVLYGSLGLLVIAIVISQLPLGVSMMKTAIGQIDQELEEAASIAGANRLRTFAGIVIPLVRPMLVSVFVLVVIAGLRDISTLVLLAQPRSLPLSVLLFEYAISGSKEAAAVVGIVITAIVFVAAALARLLGLEVTTQRVKG